MESQSSVKALLAAATHTYYFGVSAGATVDLVVPGSAEDEVEFLGMQASAAGFQLFLYRKTPPVTSGLNPEYMIQICVTSNPAPPIPVRLKPGELVTFSLQGTGSAYACLFFRVS